MADWIAAANRLEAYVAAWNQSGMALIDASAHPIAQLAALHASLERIHPFRDGNGRTGRLALNLLLVRLGYRPAIVNKRDRTKYIRALQRADAGDSRSLGELLARAVTNGIERFLLPSLAGLHRIVPLTALADRDLSLIALRRAAERGRLRALRGATSGTRRGPG